MKIFILIILISFSLESFSAGVVKGLNYSCDKDNPAWDHVTTWGTGGDFDPAKGQTMDDARRAMSRKGNVLLGVLGGEYNNVKLPFFGTSWDNITICGLSAERPILRSTGSVLSLNDIVSATVRHLEIQNGAITIGNGRLGSLEVTNVFLYGRNNNCIDSGRIDTDWLAIHGLLWATVLLKNVEVKDCGQGNTKHNVYLSSRDMKLYVEDSSFYGARESHAFKSTAAVVEVKNSFFSTVTDWNDLSKGKYSTTLLDLVSCAEVVVRGNHFKATQKGPEGKFVGSAQSLHFRARRSIYGCDKPVYGSEDFRNPEFWESLGDIALLGNDKAFPKYISGNLFEFVSTSPKTPISAIQDDGTYPRTDIQQFSSCSRYLSAPQQWKERAVVNTANNQYIGFDATNTVVVSGQECGDTSLAVFDVMPDRYHVDSGVDIPSWFKTSIDQIIVVDSGGGADKLDTIIELLNQLIRQH